MRRRVFLGTLASVPWLSACGPLKSVSASEVLRVYETGELERARGLFPPGQRVRLTDVVFHDWAYPEAERVEQFQPDPEVFREVVAKDAEGGSTFHGIKLRIGPTDEEALHRSGPKVIAFLPYSAERNVRLLKRAYRERCELTCTVSWLGVLKAEVWAFPTVEEDDMVALMLHGVRRA